MKFGKKIKPAQSKETVVEADSIRGPSWSVSKINDKYIFEYVSGEVTGKLKRHEITKSDFDELSTGDATDLDLFIKYDLS